MPTYEYRCDACGSRFEQFQKMSDDPVETCPECGEDEAERLMSAGAGLVFKGSGFYETDYKQKSGGDDSGTDGSGGEGGGSGGEAPGEGDAAASSGSGSGSEDGS